MIDITRLSIKLMCLTKNNKHLPFLQTQSFDRRLDPRGLLDLSNQMEWTDEEFQASENLLN